MRLYFAVLWRGIWGGLEFWSGRVSVLVTLLLLLLAFFLRPEEKVLRFAIAGDGPLPPLEATLGQTIAVILGVLYLLGRLVVNHASDIRAFRAEREKHDQVVTVKARPASLHMENGSDFSLQAEILMDLWTEVDVSTERLALNIIGIKRKPWWKLRGHPEQKRLFAIPPEGQDTFQYRVRILPQEFMPRTELFKFSTLRPEPLPAGLIETRLELALELSIPAGIWRAPVDARLGERGSRSPL